MVPLNYCVRKNVVVFFSFFFFFFFFFFFCFVLGMTHIKWFGRTSISFRYCMVLEEEEENEQNESVPDYLLGCSGAAAKERQNNESS